MRFCAFGARMLGEAAKTIHEMITAKRKPILIYSGLPDSPLGLCLKKFVANRWCARILLPSQYARRKFSGENIIVVGAFSERNAEAIYSKPARAIYINPFDMARPGQVKDGYFPDAVFADPRYIMPVLYRTLDEWINGKRTPVGQLISDLASYGGVASQVSRGAKALHTMARDKNCLRFLTVSGAMTVGKMDLVICDMIESGLSHAISSTGALMAHGLVSSIGLKHYKYNPAYDDTALARRKRSGPQRSRRLQPRPHGGRVTEMGNRTQPPEVRRAPARPPVRWAGVVQRENCRTARTEHLSLCRIPLSAGRFRRRGGSASP